MHAVSIQDKVLPVSKLIAAGSSPAKGSAILMRFSPPPAISASVTTSGSSGTFSIVHSQNDAISAARSTESFDASKPDSMMGIKAAAALRRLISGDGGGIWFGMPSF